eukprot:SAG25_NODE_806_length_5254_cov_1897.297963_2_plen_74_part_00
MCQYVDAAVLTGICVRAARACHEKIRRKRPGQQMASMRASMAGWTIDSDRAGGMADGVSSSQQPPARPGTCMV